MGDSDGEDSKSETSEVGPSPSKKPRLETTRSSTPIGIADFVATWNSQPVDEHELRIYEEQASRIQALEQSSEEREAGEGGKEDSQSKPNPSEWGERLGVIPSGNPNEPPIVLHCFEDLRDSDEDEGVNIGGEEV